MNNNGLVTGRLMEGPGSELENELRRLRDKIEGLDSSVGILLERLGPVTKQMPGCEDTKGEACAQPLSPLGGEVASIANHVVNMTMRVREGIERLAI